MTSSVLPVYIYPIYTVPTYSPYLLLSYISVLSFILAYSRYLSVPVYSYITSYICNNTANIIHPLQYVDLFRQSSFSAVVKFFNTIGSCFWLFMDLNIQTNHIEELYNNCKAAFSAECSQYLSMSYRILINLVG